MPGFKFLLKIQLHSSHVVTFLGKVIKRMYSVLQSRSGCFREKAMEAIFSSETEIDIFLDSLLNRNDEEDLGETDQDLQIFTEKEVIPK